MLQFILFDLDPRVGVGVGLGTKTSSGDHQGGQKERSPLEGVGLPSRGGPQEPSSSPGSGREAAEQAEGLQETNRGG